MEIHPKKRPLIEEYVKEGRFVVGPWYVMPDEFNVSGESLIRTLRLGREIALDFGGRPSSAGYMCDIFGHISQMPQILVGFQIPAAFLWRGTNPHGKPILVWEGADGSKVVVYRFGGGAYCDYACQVRRAHDPSETEYEFAQMQSEDIAISRQNPDLHPKATFFNLEGPAVMSSLQMIDGLQHGFAKKTKKDARQKRADAKRIRSLEKELKRKDKALAETAALLVLKKKSRKSGGTRTTPPPGATENDYQSC